MEQNYEIMIIGINSFNKALLIFIEQKSLFEAFKITMKCKKLLNVSDDQIILDTLSVSPENMMQFYKKHPELAVSFEYCTIDDFLNGGYKNYEVENLA